MATQQVYEAVDHPWRVFYRGKVIRENDKPYAIGATLINANGSEKGVYKVIGVEEISRTCVAEKIQ